MSITLSGGSQPQVVAGTVPEDTIFQHSIHDELTSSESDDETDKDGASFYTGFRAQKVV